jgi:hypothetical protein
MIFKFPTLFRTPIDKQDTCNIGKITQVQSKEISYHILLLIKGNDSKAIIDFSIRGAKIIEEMKTFNRPG